MRNLKTSLVVASFLVASLGVSSQAMGSGLSSSAELQSQKSIVEIIKEYFLSVSSSFDEGNGSGGVGH